MCAALIMTDSVPGTAQLACCVYAGQLTGQALSSKQLSCLTECHLYCNDISLLTSGCSRSVSAACAAASALLNCTEPQLQRSATAWHLHFVRASVSLLTSDWVSTQSHNVTITHASGARIPCCKAGTIVVRCLFPACQYYCSNTGHKHCTVSLMFIMLLSVQQYAAAMHFIEAGRVC